ncbi:MAG: LLM class flavin-dependent oxidoreductase [Chloroflexi bacterium]|nr:LLM class flavin-dependent oxidoreductase [Chloroflexota bacterium]
MKFGVFFELSVAKPWNPRSEYEVYHNALQQIEAADRLGFDQAWAVEHHFLEEYSHCSAPEVFLAAAAARTSRIRLGHGVMMVLPPFNHPLRCAERAAALDIISNGRLEFGTGRSATWTELGGFRCDPDLTKEMWDEALRAIPKMWTQETFSWESKHFSVPPRNVIPKPVQKPHPPLWVAVSSPETAIQAAERGIGCLGVSVGTPAEYEQRVKDYRRVIKQCEPAGDFVNEQVNGVTFLYVDETDDEARFWGTKLVYTFANFAAHLVGISSIYPTPAYKTPGLLFAVRREAEQQAVTPAGTPERAPGGGGVIREGMAIGTPQTVIKNLKMWEEIGVDRMVFLINSGEQVPHDRVLRSLQLFAEQVMPALDRGAPAARPRAKGRGPRRAEPAMP